jgi:ketosteroid isomerase-like protein
MKRLLIAAAAVLTLSSAARAAPEDVAKAEAQKEIWAKEQGVYAGRAHGDLGPYMANSTPEYLGWPPYSPVPYGTQGIQQNEKSWAGESHEKLTMEFKGFTLHGDTALIYYLNHRTSMPDGKPVDQKWEIIHVWVRDQGQWRLLGGMQRLGDLTRPK